MIDINLTKEKNCKVPIRVGGIGEKGFDNNYRQGNRIYSSNAIAACLLAHEWTDLYTVEVKDK